VSKLGTKSFGRRRLPAFEGDESFNTLSAKPAFGGQLLRGGGHWQGASGQLLLTFTPKWSTKLAAYDVHIWGQCCAMEQGLRFD
jgi:hypothetical protein